MENSHTGKQYYFFFQNMKKFSADNLERAKDMEDSFEKINAKLKEGTTIAVAGLAEITKNANLDALNRLCTCLDPGMKVAKGGNVFEIEKRDNTCEKLCIAHDCNVFERSSHGLVYVDEAGAWQVAQGTMTVSGIKGRDKQYRAIAYIMGTIDSKPVIVGFVHNVFTLGNKHSLPRALPGILERLKEEYKERHNIAIYIGADMNLDPKDCGVDKRFLRAPKVIGPGDSEEKITEKTSPEPTTQGGNCYDYFILNFETSQHAVVWPETEKTKGTGASDHCGVAILYEERK